MRYLRTTMDKKHILFLFFAAGLILALVIGIYVYQSSALPSQVDFGNVLKQFTERLSAGKYEDARALLTEESRKEVRDPGTVLGQTVYRELRLKSVENILQEDDRHFTADVVFTAPDTFRIMTKAGMLFGEKVVEEGPAEDPDAVLAEIYEEILSRDDLPVLDQFCVVRFIHRDGRLLIDADEAFRNAIEGGSAESAAAIEQFTSSGNAE